MPEGALTLAWAMLTYAVCTSPRLGKVQKAQVTAMRALAVGAGGLSRH